MSITMATMLTKHKPIPIPVKYKENEMLDPDMKKQLKLIAFSEGEYVYIKDKETQGVYRRNGERFADACVVERYIFFEVYDQEN